MVTTSSGDEQGQGGEAVYPLRRTPTQDRASRQVERILDAACAEVVERGYDAASTSSIAKRAEIAVGSIYRYFPDKRTLVQAIERRNQRRYTETVRERLAVVEDWRQAVDVTLDTFREMHRTDPGFRAVVLSGLGDPDLEATPGEFDDQHAGEFAELLSQRFGARDSREFRMTVTLTIAMGEALAHLADRLPAGEAEYVLSRGRPTLHRLLEPHLP
jgi:AcrR family transcriptional regulator